MSTMADGKDDLILVVIKITVWTKEFFNDFYIIVLKSKIGDV